MFSFIHKFFERRRAVAAERDKLCYGLLRWINLATSNYVNACKSKVLLQEWIRHYSELLVELGNISKFRKSIYYKQLKQQRQIFNAFYSQASQRIDAFIAKEQQKRKDDEYVSKKLNQWASEQKRQKNGASKQKKLEQKIERFVAQSKTAISVNEDCPCRGKDGKKKNLYSTEGEALVVAEYRSKATGKLLYVYPCPYGGGYHITSNQF